MKMVTTLLRILLGLVMFVFGLNGFLHFIPMQLPKGPAGDFIGALAASGYMLQLVSATQTIAGAMLLFGVYVPLALTILAPVIVNIFLFHVFLARDGLPLAIIVVALELYLAWAHRDAFAPLFGSRTASQASRAAA
jgi:uncharacterized membrane protein YphA (DoxX/SURF4 family)